ncbi:unnamed protein product [Rhizophagus irregularis]|nr:unnamed protein product [Rhizophagus irregularis]
MEKQHVLELFKLREKNPQINCNFRTSESEFLKKLDPERIRYLKTELESFSAPNCDLNLPYICDNCLHRVLHGKFSSWASGNELIDSFIQETQLSSSYERYPEWVPYNSLSQIKKIGEGGFGTVFSAMWSWGIKGIKTKDLNMHYRTGPCKVALKKLKGEMEITQTFLSEVQAQFDFCHLYGITQDPETLEYMFIMRLAPQGDLRTYLLRNFNNLSLPNKKQCDILINNIDGEHLFRSGISYKDSSIARERIHDENDRFGDPQSLNYRIKNQFANSQNAGYIYILIGWKPNKHIHTEAVYTSRSFSYKSLQDDIDIFLSRRKSNQKSNQSSIVK